MKRMSSLPVLGLVASLLFSGPTFAGEELPKTDELLGIVKLPLVDEADALSQQILENSGICTYLSEWRGKAKEGKEWVEGSPAWEHAAAVVKEEVERAKGEGFQQYTQTYLLKGVIRHGLSDSDIEKLLAIVRSDAGRRYLKTQDPVIAGQIVSSIRAPAECLTKEDAAHRDLLRQQIAKAAAETSRESREKARPLAMPDTVLLNGFLTHYLDYSVYNASQWQRIVRRLDERMNSATPASSTE